MATTTRFQREYDHRLWELVRATGNLKVALKRGVPPSTARGWVKASKAEVVTIDVTDMNTLQLQQEVLALRKRKPAAEPIRLDATTVSAKDTAS